MFDRRIVRISAIAVVGIAVVVGLAVFRVDRPAIAFAATSATNQTQEATAGTRALDATMPMSNTESMRGMMTQMTGMMDEMQAMMAADMGAMTGMQAMTGTMPMDDAEMADRMIMAGAQMEMMGGMMQMMGRMQRMGAHMPMTGTMAMANRMLAPCAADAQPEAPAMVEQSGAEAASEAIEQTATTKTYQLALAIAAPEKMLTAEEAKSATEGEVMVAGEMGMGTAERPLTHHVEVSITDRKSGELITEQPVSITVTDDTTGQVTDIPVATMYGLDAGVSETHFGNNVALDAGDYTIVVTVGDEAATFHVTIPAS